MHSMSSDEPPLKKVKVAHEPLMDLLDALSASRVVPKMEGDEDARLRGMPNDVAYDVWERLRGRKEEVMGKRRRRRGGVDKKANNGRTWRTCGVGVCLYETKRMDHMKKHKANIHSIDLVWHYCSELGCEYKAKVRSNIKVHRGRVHAHDIGATWHRWPRHRGSLRRRRRPRRREVCGGTPNSCS